jgi:hypothetical protein
MKTELEINRLDTNLIAPCGMNCGICMAYLRNKNVCRGCRDLDGSERNSCVNCIIRNCEFIKRSESKFCYDCEKFPCKRLKQLDKRYRTKYHMSMIENLDNIKTIGLEKFVRNEYKRWLCKDCGGTICVHRGYCLKCKQN